MVDVILRSDRRILTGLNIDGTNYFTESHIEPGGSGNIAAAISHLGGRAALIGKAGDDVYGRAYVEDLQRLGIATKVILDPDADTGVVISLVEPGGHRTMLVTRGANDRLRPYETKKCLKELGAAKFLYFSGYSLLNSPQRESVLEAAKIGRGQTVTIVFDVASSNLVRSHPEVFRKAVDSCDILCANLDEAKALARKSDFSEYAQTQSKKGKIVIVKMGPLGCLIARNGKTTKVSGFEVKPVDTTGAGDAFLGGLLYSTSRGINLEKAASFGNWFASGITVSLGPRHFPSKADSLAFLNRSN
jgi:sugar/nucleoside kinase (ribokinase family)